MIGKFLKNFFGKSSKEENPSSEVLNNEEMKKFLIVGLGNIGSDYEGTRHNAGFMVVDTLAEEKGVSFKSCRYGTMAKIKVKNCELLLLKPSTFMNLSGNAVKYWVNQENIGLENLLVVVDDLALPFGTIRLRGKGSDAGHNGLKNIAEMLGTQNYPRLRFGVGNDFEKGMQIDFVLSRFNKEERKQLPEILDRTAEAVKAFCLSGLAFAMTHYNGDKVIPSNKNKKNKDSSTCPSEGKVENQGKPDLPTDEIDSKLNENNPK